ncbi:hypothetical protein I9W82_004463 [Candida metapsilosis]|uniref:Uncharacterized protein n=1 Tax=Candida metapsilosis TaxID=273372 RepID=A0A8H7ZCR8_9ASCO|nr:hypothetical protein I9W82_004463 [Candida metapsilosis]
MSSPSSTKDISNEVIYQGNCHNDDDCPQPNIDEHYNVVSPIKSKSTSNLPKLSLLDTKPICIHNDVATDVMSSQTTPIHPLHSSHNHNLIDSGQEEMPISHPYASAGSTTAPHPRSLHSIPPLPTQQTGYSPIGQIIFRYIERWVLGFIERHREGPYFYPIAISIGIVFVIIVLILALTGDLDVLMRILRHLICELIQSVHPSSTIQFCV